MAKHVTVVPTASGLNNPALYEAFLNANVTGPIEWIFTHGRHVIIWRD